MAVQLTGWGRRRLWAEVVDEEIHDLWPAGECGSLTERVSSDWRVIQAHD